MNSNYERIKDAALRAEYPMELRDQEGRLVYCGLWPDSVTYTPERANGASNGAPNGSVSMIFHMKTKDIPHATRDSMCYFTHVQKFKTILELSTGVVLQRELVALQQALHQDSQLWYYIRRCIESLERVLEEAMP